MDNNQDKYTNYTYNGEGSTNGGDNSSYYSQPQGNYNQPYTQPQNNYNQPYNQPQNNYNQPYNQPQNNYNQPNYSQNPYYGQSGYSAPQYGTYNAPKNQHARIDGFCISSLACGIMSIPMGFCYGVGLIFSIIAFIMRGIYRNRHDRKDNGFTKGGLITAIIGIVTCVLFYAIVIITVIASIAASESV